MIKQEAISKYGNPLNSPVSYLTVPKLSNLSLLRRAPLDCRVGADQSPDNGAPVSECAPQARLALWAPWASAQGSDRGLLVPAGSPIDNRHLTKNIFIRKI
ncbi:hypothetical protein EVAR_68739_1 [Eumeta japonica]|uniref:Uncharacterized protein n=1 Tax=Eumeta variegata TaxID=151549 RepID=A0A4C1ZMT1_EUMVA|nr:hypothetical protein EVAR_68739_1 [Eumeta japonica]